MRVVVEVVDKYNPLFWEPRQCLFFSSRIFSVDIKGSELNFYFSVHFAQFPLFISEDRMQIPTRFRYSLWLVTIIKKTSYWSWLPLNVKRTCLRFGTCKSAFVCDFLGIFVNVTDEVGSRDGWSIRPIHSCRVFPDWDWQSEQVRPVKGNRTPGCSSTPEWFRGILYLK